MRPGDCNCSFENHGGIFIHSFSFLSNCHQIEKASTLLLPLRCIFVCFISILKTRRDGHAKAETRCRTKEQRRLWLSQNRFRVFKGIAAAGRWGRQRGSQSHAQRKSKKNEILQKPGRMERHALKTGLHSLRVRAFLRWRVLRYLGTFVHWKQWQIGNGNSWIQFMEPNDA